MNDAYLANRIQDILEKQVKMSGGGSKRRVKRRTTKKRGRGGCDYPYLTERINDVLEGKIRMGGGSKRRVKKRRSARGGMQCNSWLFYVGEVRKNLKAQGKDMPYSKILQFAKKGYPHWKKTNLPNSMSMSSKPKKKFRIGSKTKSSRPKYSKKSMKEAYDTAVAMNEMGLHPDEFEKEEEDEDSEEDRLLEERMNMAKQNSRINLGKMTKMEKHNKALINRVLKNQLEGNKILKKRAYAQKHNKRIAAKRGSGMLGGSKRTVRKRKTMKKRTGSKRVVRKRKTMKKRTGSKRVVRKRKIGSKRKISRKSSKASITKLTRMLKKLKKY